MPNLRPLTLIVIGSIVMLATSARANVFVAAPKSDSKFLFKSGNGKTQSVPVVTKYYSKKIEHPVAKVDRRLDPKLMQAATLAQERAHAHSNSMCWAYVKKALLGSGVIKSYPKTAYAKQAGEELVRDFGFRKLPVRDPYSAPVGSVLVYSHGSYAGHVEIRTKDGFVSDFHSKTACSYPLIAVYGKFGSQL